MKILVTGAKGQLGRSIEKLSKDSEHKFVFTDLDELDITNPSQVDEVLKEGKFDVLVNTAAYTNVEKAETEVTTAFKVNVEAVMYLAEGCQKYHCRLIHISTDYVFDGTAYRPYTPQDTTNPVNAYGMTKCKGEEMALKYCEDVNVVRTSWLYSEYGNNFVKTMLNLGRTKESINVVCDQVGTPCYALDLAKGILKLVDTPTKEKILHFSSQGICSWYDFSKKIMEIKNLNCKVNPILSSQFPQAATRPNFTVLDKSLTTKVLGIEIPHWEDSLKEMLKNVD